MTQTKADREAAAKKAAATRERNRVKEESQERGQKAGASRQRNAATDSLGTAKHAAGSAVGGLTTAAKAVGEAVKQGGKSVATRAGVGRKS